MDGSKQLTKIHPANFSNNDLSRSIARVKQRPTTEFGVALDQIYGDVHKYDELGWHYLSIPEQLNCR